MKTRQAILYVIRKTTSFKERFNVTVTRTIDYSDRMCGIGYTCNMMKNCYFLKENKNICRNIVVPKKIYQLNKIHL